MSERKLISSVLWAGAAAGLMIAPYFIALKWLRLEVKALALLALLGVAFFPFALCWMLVVIDLLLMREFREQKQLSQKLMTAVLAVIVNLAITWVVFGLTLRIFWNLYDAFV